eukprot:351613-Chlamydomonas_euryale.AAC.2
MQAEAEALRARVSELQHEAAASLVVRSRLQERLEAAEAHAEQRLADDASSFERRLRAAEADAERRLAADAEALAEALSAEAERRLVDQTRMFERRLADQAHAFERRLEALEASHAREVAAVRSGAEDRLMASQEAYREGVRAAQVWTGDAMGGCLFWVSRSDVSLKCAPQGCPSTGADQGCPSTCAPQGCPSTSGRVNLKRDFHGWEGESLSLLFTLTFPDAITSISSAAKSQPSQRAPRTRPGPGSTAHPGYQVAHKEGLHNIIHSRHGELKTVSYVQPAGAS